MNLSLRSELPELMDASCSDFADYQKCLEDLARVNRVTLAYRPVLAWLENVCCKPEQTCYAASGYPAQAGDRFSLLDVGCGYGDMLRRIRRRHPHALLTGVDRNPWATRAARQATPPDAKIRYETAGVFQYAPSQTDYIISTQFAHHLTDAEVIAFIAWMERHAARGWLINDLHRHRFAYYGFHLLARAMGWHRFVRHDGPVSIARSFRPADWRRLLGNAGLAGAGAEIRWFMPFRLCVARSR